MKTHFKFILCFVGILSITACGSSDPDLPGSGGTGGAGIGPPGGGDLRRFHYPALDSLRAVHRNRSVCGAGNGTDFNGHQPHVVPDSGLCHLPEHDVFRAPDFHRRSLRLRRRGIRPHDHHVSPPLCHGGL